MTVGELIAMLSHFDRNKETYTRDRDGDLRPVDDIWVADDGELMVDY